MPGPRTATVADAGDAARVRYCGGMTTTTFKEALETGTPQVGLFTLEFATTGIGALAAQSGADWILYDLEHTGWSLDDVRNSLAVSRRLDIASFVRVAGHRKDLVSTALDAGAEGIMMPWVQTAEQAAEMVSWMKYPPMGQRGSAFGLPHDLYQGGDPAVSQANANAFTVFLPQIETPAAVENARAIGEVDGVDVLFVGPLDLSTNLGVPGRWDDPTFLDALDQVVAAGRDSGTATGIFCPSVEFAQMAWDKGFTVLSDGADLSVFARGLTQGLSTIRAHATGTPVAEAAPRQGY